MQDAGYEDAAVRGKRFVRNDHRWSQRSRLERENASWALIGWSDLIAVVAIEFVRERRNGDEVAGMPEVPERLHPQADN
jgi:hypothetical protein